MTDEQWVKFFTASAEILGKGEMSARWSETWCAWTTFSRLNSDCGYWTRGLPNLKDIDVNYIKDGGVWGQPFMFKEIAHIIVPREFFWEKPDPGYLCGYKTQDIKKLSERLIELEIPHNLSQYCLDIKLF